MLEGIIEEMEPYAAGNGDLIPLQQCGEEWTNEWGNATIQTGNIPFRSKADLIQELQLNGEKFSEKDMLFITKDSTGQIIWLEKGTPFAGLEHIVHGNGTTPGHAEDFARAFGISQTEIPAYLERVIAYGRVVSNTLKPVGNRMGFERIYYYEGNYYVLVGIGTNGFIVSAYPIS